MYARTSFAGSGVQKRAKLATNGVFWVILKNFGKDIRDI